MAERYGTEPMTLPDGLVDGQRLRELRRSLARRAHPAHAGRTAPVGRSIDIYNSRPPAWPVAGTDRGAA